MDLALSITTDNDLPFVSDVFSKFMQENRTSIDVLLYLGHKSMEKLRGRIVPLWIGQNEKNWWCTDQRHIYSVWDEDSKKKINTARVCLSHGWFEVCDKDSELKEKGR